MPLESCLNVEWENQKNIRVRIQELDPDNTDGRPYEEDLTENGWHADSIGDLPLPNDFISLEVDIQKQRSSLDDPQFERKRKVFKILTRYFSFRDTDKNPQIVICNIVVEPVDSTVVGKLIKD